MSDDLDDKLPHLVEDIDETLLNWTIANKLTPDVMIAIVLARLTIVAKEVGCEGHMIAILDKAKYNLVEESIENKETLH